MIKSEIANAISGEIKNKTLTSFILIIITIDFSSVENCDL